jgi:hypothetical protein
MALDPNLINKILSNPDDAGIPAEIRGLSSDDQKAARRVLASAKKKAATTKKGSSAVTNMTKSIKNQKSALADLVGGYNDITNVLIGPGSFMGAVNKTIDRIENFRIQLNKLAVEDSRAVILGLRRQQDALRDYGVQYDVLINATAQFRENLNELASTSYQRNREQLLRVAAVNERFGVSVQTSVLSLNKMNRGFNVTGNQADRFSRTLLNFARNTGQPFARVFSDFNNSIDQFFVTMDSDRALRRFTVFQQTARRLGTTVKDLLGVVDKFDELGSGFETGGQINMLLSNLGGAFDAQRAMLMTRPERLRYLAESVAGVGGKIRGMSELGQRAMIRQLAQTTGFDIGTIRGFIDKGVGGDIDRLLAKSDSLTAMTANEQRRLADEMTTREEKQQQISDRLITERTMQSEKLLQEGTRGIVDLQNTIIDVFAEKMEPALNGLEKQVTNLTRQLKQKLNIEVTGTVTGKRLALRSDPPGIGSGT